MNKKDREIVEVLCKSVAVHINSATFDYLISELIELGALEAESAEPALEMYDLAVIGEDF